MEGFIDIRLPAWLRRLTTRLIAIIPAVFVTLWYGEGQTGKLLILSQVILAFQLPFAIVPLVMFTRDKAKLGALVAPLWLTIVAGVIAAIIIALITMYYCNNPLAAGGARGSRRITMRAHSCAH